MKIIIPTTCPCCNSTLELRNDQLFCNNKECSAQILKQVEHFSKVLGIKGLGPKTIEKLELQNLSDLYALDRDTLVSLLKSERIADKIISEIEATYTATLDKVLAAFGIPMIGNTLSQKICKVVDSVWEIDQDACKRAGLGNVATTNLLNWVENDFPVLMDKFPFSWECDSKVQTDNNNKTVCITGKLVSYKTKAEAAKVLEAAGYKVVESITKSTDYLVDENNNNSTKRKKADELGITIITNLKDFISNE